jgi:hypothetical protein
MTANSKSMIEAPPVSQDLRQMAEIEVWEPPFERWMRIADSLLGSFPGAHCEIYPRPQNLAPFPRG